MIWITRFPLLVVIITAGTLLIPSQTAEVFRVLTEDADTKPAREAAVLLVFTIGALLALSLQLWWFSRVVLYLQAPQAIVRKGGAGWVARHAPRLYAMAPIAAVALLVLPVDASMKGGLTITSGRSPAAWALFASLCVSGAALYVALWRRRRVFRMDGNAGMTRRRWCRVRDLPRATRWAAGGSAAASVVLITLVAIEPLWARWAGAGAVLLIAGALWVPVGTLLCWWGDRSRFPYLTALFGLAVLWGLLDRTDNHAIRRMPAPTQAQPGANVQAVFDEWLRQRANLDAYDEYPVILVSAEGGGIYAAYHAAMALAALQDAQPAFAQHVFAISGVSGGSVGAALFAAMCADYASNSDAPQPWPVRPQDLVDDALGRDLLAPLIAAGLFPDLAQRFWPWAIERVDRARALERSLEKAWAANQPPTPRRFDQPLESLWVDFMRDAAPALLLNTTSVETGRRMVVTNLPLQDKAFRDLDTLRDWLPDHSVRLSTGAIMSARFPIVAPAATIPLDDGAKRRVVDGGYYENSGAATLADLLTAIESGPPLDTPVEFIVLQIDLERDVFAPPRGLAALKTHGLGEPLSPLRALLSTRIARGGGARHALLHLAGRFAESGTAVQLFPIQLRRRQAPLPLGWLLSERAREDIVDQLIAPAGASGALLKEVADRLRRTAEPRRLRGPH